MLVIEVPLEWLMIGRDIPGWFTGTAVRRHATRFLQSEGTPNPSYGGKSGLNSLPIHLR